MKSYVAVALVSTMLTACGSIANKTGVEAFAERAAPSGTSGVVLLSAGAPAHCVSMATFLSVREFATGKVVESVPSIGVDVYVHKSDYASHHGTLNAMQLPSGVYYLTPSVANPYFKTIQAPTFIFEVKPQEVSYVGELFMTTACGTTSNFVVRDQYDRDVTFAKQRNKGFAERPVVKRLLRPGSPTDKT